MQKETIEFEHGRVEVFIEGNLIYFNVFGEYAGKDALSVTKYLEKMLGETSESTIRVWDTTNLPKNRSELITPNISILFEWSRRRRIDRPDDVVYIINDNPVKDGASGMYDPVAFFEDFSLIVVNNIDELPENIKKRIHNLEVQYEK